MDDFLKEWDMNFNQEQEEEKKGYETTYDPTRIVNNEENAFLTEEMRQTLDISKFDSNQSNYFLLLNAKNQGIVKKR